MADLTTKIELYCKANGKTVLFGRNVLLANEGSSISTWSVDGLIKPTDSQLNSYEASGNKEEANKEIRNTRRLAYGSIGDQLDNIYHNGVDEWKKTIKAVKDKYPKE